MFIDSQARVPVTLDGNTIYIKAKMDLATRSAVQDEIAAKGAGSDEVEVRGIGSYRMALLVHNIVGWEGPAFEGVTCNRTNIMRLDPEEPLVEAVAAEIGERNKPKESPDPN